VNDTPPFGIINCEGAGGGGRPRPWIGKPLTANIFPFRIYPSAADPYFPIISEGDTVYATFSFEDNVLHWRNSSVASSCCFATKGRPGCTGVNCRNKCTGEAKFLLTDRGGDVGTVVHSYWGGGIDPGYTPYYEAILNVQFLTFPGF
jgi:hypothetical protein